MICHFASFSTAFQSYQDDSGWVVGEELMKGCVKWNHIYGWKDFHRKLGSNPGPLDLLGST